VTPRIDKLTTAELVKQFENAAREQGQATRALDSRTANARFKVMLKIYERLKIHGIAAQRLLLPLLHSDDVYVRYWAAEHALDFDSRHAVATLEQIFEANTGTIRFNARMSLEHWRKHRLRLEKTDGKGSSEG
jgi:Domain of unknown function (DUF2019)